jgi:hypothetical protein
VIRKATQRELLRPLIHWALLVVVLVGCKTSIEPTATSTPASPLHKQSTIWFPPDNGTIGISQPTIIGKIRQSNPLLLSTRYHTNYNNFGNNLHALEFLPGKVQNARFLLDDQSVDKVYGFAQYPAILCGSEGHTIEEGECIDAHREPDDPDVRYDYVPPIAFGLPPIVFVFRPDRPLREGNHAFTVGYEGITETVTFSVDLNLELPLEDISRSKEELETKVPPELGHRGMLLDDSEGCARGFFHKASYVHLPLPIIDNENLFYIPVFPRDKQDARKAERCVQFVIDGHQFDLIFPQSSVFYNGADYASEQQLLPWQSLYLPMDFLYFSNGEKAEPLLTVRSTFDWDEYLEILPMDRLGRLYEDDAIPFTATASSSCDG